MMCSIEEKMSKVILKYGMTWWAKIYSFELGPM